MTAENLFQVIFMFWLASLFLRKPDTKGPDAGVIVGKILRAGWFVCASFPFKIIMSLFKALFAKPLKDISQYLKRCTWVAARCSGNLMLMLFKALFILGQNLFFKIVRR